MADYDRPYVGYRSAGRRPESQQDRRASADAPLAALRGIASGVLGAPGDLESLLRMLPGLSEKTILPTSEDVERRLPLRAVSETPTGRAFTGLGQLGGGFYTGPGSPLRLVAGLPSAVKRAAGDFVRSAGVPTANVIKPKGGNWLEGSVEEALRGLKRDVLNEEGYANLAARVSPEHAAATRAERAPDAALNTWIDKQLTRYIKNEMATPEDPLRALAERGVTHREHLMPREDDISGVADVRVGQDFPAEGYGQSPQAQAWEALADVAVDEPARAGERWGEATLAANPWLRKVTPETPVYGEYLSTDNLGFSHLIDELRNATNPASGLPRELLLKYESLPQVSVPQAVERVSNINAWRAAQKAEANAAKANNAATVLHKEYPDKGFKWVELKAPEVNMQELGYTTENVGGKFHAVDPQGRVVPNTRAESAAAALKRARSADLKPKELEDALKYEGDTMGHCVGGYCPDVIEGRSRIFSLRSAKGEPHVTVETRPQVGVSPYDYWYQSKKDTPELDEFLGWMRENVDNLSEGGLDAWYKNWAQSTGREIMNPPTSIVQIKGKQNRAPNPEYLPYVQDFVKSGKWSDVGDLQNTGLRRTSDAFNDTEQAFLRSKGVELKPYIEPEETARYQEMFKRTPDVEPGFATGGPVASSVYDEAKIDAILNSLREELHG